MEISLEDFNFLSAEQSRRDVEIAKLGMELQMRQTRYEQELAALKSERDAMWAEATSLREQLELLQTDYENVRFQNHWMRQYILLSVERVRDFFAHIRDFAALSAIKLFVMDMLPPEATPEQIAYTRDIMRIPMAEEEPQITVNVAGSYNDFHDNGSISINDK